MKSRGLWHVLFPLATRSPIELSPQTLRYDQCASALKSRDIISCLLDVQPSFACDLIFLGIYVLLIPWNRAQSLHILGAPQSQEE